MFTWLKQSIVQKKELEKEFVKKIKHVNILTMVIISFILLGKL